MTYEYDSHKQIINTLFVKIKLINQYSYDYYFNIYSLNRNENIIYI